MKNATTIAFVVDRSGSMQSCVADVIGGFNRFIEDQKKDQSPCSVSFAQFNARVEDVFVDVPLGHVAPLTEKLYRPEGNTALLDALGRTIVSLGRRLEAMPEEERPRNVIVVTMTDGAENASREYTFGRVKEMVRHQTDKYKWTFVFLGANIDAFAAGSQLGIAAANVANFGQHARGLAAAYGATSHAVLRSRSLAARGQAVAPTSFYSSNEQKEIDDTAKSSS